GKRLIAGKPAGLRVPVRADDGQRTNPRVQPTRNRPCSLFRRKKPVFVEQRHTVLFSFSSIVHGDACILPVPVEIRRTNAMNAAKPSAPDSLVPQHFRLDGRHALVTGAASGIGEATVKELVRAGAFVWIADINLQAAQALADSMPAADVVHLDVT